MMIVSDQVALLSLDDGDLAAITINYCIVS